MDHGGDLSEARRRYGTPAEGWLDLSTGINPNPYPLPELPQDCLTRLPDRAQLKALEAAARGAYRVPADVDIVAAPGTQALIQIVPRLLTPGSVSIAGPTYTEHARAWRAAGHLVAEAAPAEGRDAGAVVVVNPNNPDGARHPAAALTALADRLSAAGGLLVIDEAFADAHPEVSLVSEAARPAMLVLRSFGKFFGLAGLRLGFAIGPHRSIERLRALLGPWAVSGPAIEAGRIALSDAAWIARTRSALQESAKQLDGLLARHGLEVVGGTSLFRLVETPDAPALHEGLARRGIWTRIFADAPNRLRLGLPAGESRLRRLDEALAGLTRLERRAS